MTGGYTDIKEAGIALEMTAKSQITPNSIDMVIANAAQKLLDEGRVTLAIQQLNNPGKILKPDEARDRTIAIFKEDSLDPTNHTLKSSTEQYARKTEVGRIAYAISELAEKGFDKMSQNEQNLLTNLLSEVFANHPVFKALAQSKNIDIESLSKEMAISFLKNQAVGEAARNALVDLLINRSIDYTKLHKLLNERIKLAKSVEDLESEQKTLESEIESKKEELKKFTFEIIPDSSGSPPLIKPVGSEAESRLKAQERIKIIPEEISKLNQAIINIRNHFARTGADTLEIIDPITNTSINIDKSSAYQIIHEYNSKIIELQREKKRLEAIVDEINRKEAELKKQLKELEDSLRQKREQLKNTKSLLDSKDEEIKIEQDLIKQKELELLENVKKCLVGAALGEWEKSYEVVKTAKTEAEKQAEVDIKERIKKDIIDTIWDEAKKVFKTKELDKQLESLLNDGVIKYGDTFLENLENKALSQQAPPELKRLLPYIQQIRQDPEKLKSFSSEIASYMLKVVAVRDPDKLKHKFTRDQIIYAKLTGDILPDLILQAVSDKTIASEVEKYVGKELTKKTLKEILAGMDWKKIFAILSIILGLGVGGVILLPGFKQIIQP